MNYQKLQEFAQKHTHSRLMRQGKRKTRTDESKESNHLIGKYRQRKKRINIARCSREVKASTIISTIISLIMQFSTIFVAITALMAINVSANKYYHHEDDCYAVDANSKFARTSGIVSTLFLIILFMDTSET